MLSEDYQETPLCAALAALALDRKQFGAKNVAAQPAPRSHMHTVLRMQISSKQRAAPSTFSYGLYAIYTFNSESQTFYRDLARSALELDNYETLYVPETNAPKCF